MKHGHICHAATVAANAAAASAVLISAELADQLYRYSRDRKFPTAETLARRYAMFLGAPFEYDSLAAAPEGVQAWFQNFIAVAAALEQFHQEDGDWTPPADPATALYNDAQAKLAELTKKVDELEDNAAIGASLMGAIEIYAGPTGEGPLKDWAPAEDPAEIVGDLVTMLQERDHRIEQLEAKLKEADVTDPDKKADDVENRTQSGQQSMDEAIQESGGADLGAEARKADAKKKKK